MTAAHDRDLLARAAEALAVPTEDPTTRPYEADELAANIFDALDLTNLPADEDTIVAALFADLSDGMALLPGVTGSGSTRIQLASLLDMAEPEVDMLVLRLGDFAARTDAISVRTVVRPRDAAVAILDGDYDPFGSGVQISAHVAQVVLGAFDETPYRGMPSDFTGALMRAIITADSGNRRRLARAFPDYVAAANLYNYTDRGAEILRAVARRQVPPGSAQAEPASTS